MTARAGANDARPIVRIFLARVHEGTEETWEALVDRQINRELRAAPGLLAWYRCRSISDDHPREFVVITIWRDRVSERQFAGASAQPMLPPGATQLVEFTSAIEYELDDSSTRPS